ncbi:TRAP transporter substrate-binding protein [Mariluticola halotolerans]|uniref:TRAP transporter substrate-binding protein n=1 Tax=Mariluticola halotolerans TaxID=2909283 RepID=UPI0026E29F91|nr:TRAP transporter substrate-binding protein [Mariluticola halotolerans]UJQ93923.1 TRAP transporter substrate-binding protein [Mariluticola halotolerans]
MDRRSFFKKAGVASVGAAGAATLAAPAIAQESPTLNWRLTSSFPKALDTIYGAAETMAGRVAAATDGKFNIQVYAAGELVPGLQALDAVTDNTVEMCHTCSYYFWGKEPTFQLGTATPFVLNSRMQNAWLAYGGGRELLDNFYAENGVKGFYTGNTGAQMGGWFRKEINTVEDLNGLKMRIGGFAGTILSKLGVTPQLIGGGEIYQALEKGTIDAAEWVGPYDDQKLGFNKVAKYYYYPGFWEGGANLHTFINLDKFKELPSHYQEILEDACAYAHTDTLASYDAKNPAAVKQLVADGAILRPFSQEILTAAYEASQEVYAEYSAKSPHFKAVYESQLAYAKEAYLWQQLSEYTFDTFMMVQQRNGKL